MLSRREGESKPVGRRKRLIRPTWYNSDRFAIPGNCYEITYLNFRFSNSRSTVGLILELRRAFASGEALIDFDLEYCNSPIGNCSAVQSVNDALGSVTNERLLCFLNSLPRLNAYNIVTGWKPKCPLKTGWR